MEKTLLFALFLILLHKYMQILFYVTIKLFRFCSRKCVKNDLPIEIILRYVQLT